MNLHWINNGIGPRLGPLLIVAGLATLSAPTAARAMQQEPYDEDEWYDPTDWFDGNNVEWDDTYEWYDEGRDEDGYGWHYEWDPHEGQWEREYGSYDDFDEGYTYDAVYDADDTGYGWHYEWDPYENEWERRYGHYDRFYDSTYDEPTYGWHYRWDPDANQWQRTRGWHDSYYVYEPFDDASDRSDRRSASRSDATAAKRFEVVAGRVAGFRRIDDRDGSHTLVRIRMQDGRSRVIDLGKEVSLSELDLANGDHVRIQGRSGRRAGQDVVMASSIEVGGDRTNVPRSDKGSRASRPARDRQEMGTQTSFEGRLAGFKEVDVGGSRNLLVRMTLEDGSQRVVDFGPKKSLAALDLQEGDRVSVRGQTRQRDGKTILVAESCRIEGEPAGQRTSEGTRAFAGTLERFERAAVASLPDHLVLRLDFRDGRSQIVDLGPTLELTQLELENGDQLKIRGEEQLKSGKRVIMAEELSIDGTSFEVSRDGAAEGTASSKGSG